MICSMTILPPPHQDALRRDVVSKMKLETILLHRRLRLRHLRHFLILLDFLVCLVPHSVLLFVLMCPLFVYVFIMIVIC